MLLVGHTRPQERESFTPQPKRKVPRYPPKDLRRHTIETIVLASPRAVSADMDSLQVTRTSTPKQITPNSELVFGKYMTDHMILLEWTTSQGWIHPRIVPYQNLSLNPANSTLQWGMQAFEGMKAFKDKKGTLRLFRPEKNMERMNKSTDRIAMLPNVDSSLVVNLLKKFVDVEERFIPS